MPRVHHDDREELAYLRWREVGRGPKGDCDLSEEGGDEGQGAPSTHSPNPAHTASAGPSSSCTTPMVVGLKQRMPPMRCSVFLRTWGREKGGAPWRWGWGPHYTKARAQRRLGERPSGRGVRGRGWVWEGWEAGPSPGRLFSTGRRDGDFEDVAQQEARSVNVRGEERRRVLDAHQVLRVLLRGRDGGKLRRLGGAGQRHPKLGVDARLDGVLLEHVDANVPAVTDDDVVQPEHRVLGALEHLLDARGRGMHAGEGCGPLPRSGVPRRPMRTRRGTLARGPHTWTMPLLCRSK